MRRYTLHLRVAKKVEGNEILVDISPPQEFSTQKTLAAAFAAQEDDIKEGQYLVGFDNRTPNCLQPTRLHFTYKVTQQERWNYRVDHLQRDLEGRCKSVREWIDRAVDALDEPQADLGFEFSWATDAVRDAANVTVLRRVLSLLRKWEEEGRSIEERSEAIYAEALDSTLRLAHYPARSTSPTANLAEQETLAAWTEIIARFTPPKE